MGIKCLWGFVKEATRETHISEIKGKTIDVDGYVLLHSGTLS